MKHVYQLLNLFKTSNLALFFCYVCSNYSIILVLLNGAKCIGSGYNTFIPQYNPQDVIANIRRQLKCETMELMVPWYRDFEGKIEKINVVCEKGEYVYTTYGKCDDGIYNTV